MLIIARTTGVQTVLMNGDSNTRVICCDCYVCITICCYKLRHRYRPGSQ